MKTLLRHIVSGILIVGLAAVASAQESEPTEFVFAHPGPIRTMDAPVTWFGSTHWLTNTLYDCLIWRAPDGDGYVGQAAERWEAIDDVTWRFYLREGLTFHNGEPLDADAVKWNIDRVTSREDFMVQPQWSFVDSVQVVDDLTVDVITDGPHAYTEYDISYNGCQLLPPEYMEEVGEEQFAQFPVGSGPYRLATFSASDRYVFEAWDDYWAGRPEVDRIVYQVIPEVASQVAALLAGQVDLISQVPEPDRERIEQANGVSVVRGAANRGHQLYLRTGADFGGLLDEYPGYEPSSTDIRIRQAVSHALDRELLAEVQGSARPAVIRVTSDQPEGQVGNFADPEFISDWYDPALAKQLIIEAGYDPDAGDRPVLHFETPAFQFGGEKEVAEVASVMLEDVGFDVRLRVLDASAFFEQVYNPGINREMMMVTLGSSPSLVPLFYMCDWTTTYRRVCDPEWDEVSEQILGTVDPDERLALWEAWWTFYLEQAETVTLYEMWNYVGMSDEFEWEPRFDGWFTFRDLKVRR